MFEGVDGEPYFCAQWFYRAKDTVIQDCSNFIDDKRIFLSEMKDDNPLDCLTEKLKIVWVTLDVDMATKRAMLANGDYYLVPFSSYQNLPPDNDADGNESNSTISSESDSNLSVTKVSKTKEDKKNL